VSNAAIRKGIWTFVLNTAVLMVDVELLRRFFW
jgi:hypothetical protein